MGEKYISKIAQGDNTYYIKDLNAVSGSSLTSNNIIIGGGNSSVSASGKSIETSLTANSDNAVPTSKAVATYVATNIANATRYKGGFNANSSNGTIDGGYTTLKSVKEVIGDMYTVTTAGTFLGQPLEVGDSIIFKADVAAGTAPIASNVVFVEGTTSISVPSTTPTLSWGQTSTIGTVEGVDLKITMPSAISVMGASGSSHASGLVPDTPTTAGTTKFLREDGTWNEPPCVGEPLPNVYIGEPSTTAAYMIYFNTTTSKFYQRNNNNTSWAEIPTLPKALGYDVSGNQTYEIINGVVSQTVYDWSSNLWYVDYTGDWGVQIGVPVYYDSGYFFPNSYYYGVMPSSSTINNCLSSVALPTGCTTRTSLSDITTGYRMSVATISTNQSTVSVLGGVSNLKAGYELHVIVKATADVTITLPTSSPYVLCGDDSALSLSNGDIAEINFISDGTNIYVRSIV